MSLIIKKFKREVVIFPKIIIIIFLVKKEKKTQFATISELDYSTTLKDCQWSILVWSNNKFCSFTW